MPHSLRYLWHLIQQAAHDWWDWFWGDTVIGSVAALGMALFGVWVLPKLAAKFPYLQRFAGGETVDNVINAAGAAILFAAACFVLFLIRAPWQIHAAQEQTIVDLRKELEQTRSAVVGQLPKIVLEIHDAIELPYQEKDGDPFSTLVIAYGSLKNQGEASIAEKWSAAARMPDGSEHGCEHLVHNKSPFILEGKVEFAINPTHERIEIKSSDLLQHKALKAIPRGAAEFGFAILSFPTVPYEDKPRDITYALCFYDVYNRMIVANFTAKPDNGEMPSRFFLHRW